MSDEEVGAAVTAVPVERPPITFATCQAWARAIIAVRGMPPYSLSQDIEGTAQEMADHDLAIMAIINDFCEHWKNRL